MIELFRKYLAFELLKDDKIEILYHKEFRDYRHIHKGWKNIKLMPYADTEKKRLREYIVHSNEITYLKIKSGTLYIYTWENGECRYFIKTDNNTLLESYTQSFWYACFPFILGMMGDRVYFEDKRFKHEGTLNDFIWLQNTKNFCHFIFDSIAPYSTLSHWMKDWEDYRNDIQMITAGELNDWQKDLLNNVGINNRGKEIRCIENVKNSQYSIQNMYIALQTNQMISHESLRKSFSTNQDNNKVKPEIINENKVIFITRKDQRRKRLINIDEIEKYIQSKGGKVVDATKLDVETKKQIFKSCMVCVAEGSGCMNWALFAPEKCKLIHLIDPSVINKAEFTYGGHIYFISMVHNIRYLIGESHRTIEGSPLGSSYFNIKELDELIMKELRVN